MSYFTTSLNFSTKIFDGDIEWTIEKLMNIKRFVKSPITVLQGFENIRTPSINLDSAKMHRPKCTTSLPLFCQLLWTCIRFACARVMYFALQNSCERWMQNYPSTTSANGGSQDVLACELRSILTDFPNRTVYNCCIIYFIVKHFMCERYPDGIKISSTSHCAENKQLILYAKSEFIPDSLWCP